MATSVGLQRHALYESHVFVMLCMHEHECDEGLADSLVHAEQTWTSLPTVVENSKQAGNGVLHPTVQGWLQAEPAQVLFQHWWILFVTQL